MEDAVKLGKECAAGALVLFHHSLARTDAALDEIAARAADLAGELPVVVARQGETVDVRRAG